MINHTIGKPYTIWALLDMNKAFDRVNHVKLLDQIKAEIVYLLDWTGHRSFELLALHTHAELVNLYDSYRINF